MISESKLCTASIMGTYRVAFYRKLLVESIIDISTKNENTVEYIYSCSLYSENLPNQKWIFAGMFFGNKLVLKYWYKKLIQTLKCDFYFYYDYQSDIWPSPW